MAKSQPVSKAREAGIYDFRTPFQLAIADPKLLGGAWRQLSRPQQVALKAFYGLPLADREELKLWSAFQGFGVYDELGYLQDITYEVPYVAKEYDTITGIIGRRSGKSDRIGGLAAAYEITLGGHSAYIKAGQPTYWLYIAQDLDTAKLNLKFVLSWIKESPLLAKMIVNETAEEVEFANGIILKAEPPNIRTGRGAAVVGITMDEMAFWYKNAKSANPDFEVIRALEYATAQFPFAKQIRITTPWTKEGVAYLSLKQGTEGSKLSCLQCGPSKAHLCTHVSREDKEEFEGSLVLYSPTAAMENPRITRRKLLRLRKRDPEAFKRESLAQFIDSQSSFLTFSSVERAVVERLETREPVKGVDYVAAIDPAFRHDSFAFTIGHNEEGVGIVQDYVIEWVPEPGERLNPREKLAEVKEVVERFGIDLIYSDQGQYEALSALAEDYNLTIVGIDFTTKSKPKMFQNLGSLFNQGRIKILDHPIQEAQLKSIQKTVTGSYVSYAAPPGKHDDMAMALALMVSQALLMPAWENPSSKPGAIKRVQYISQADLDKLYAKKLQAANYDEFEADQLKRWALLDAFGDDQE